eukprot:TRINITY_DN2130_c0_g1_i13.p2 TRINITY_DN2130_c0_g1~~TRINITY_DN2130_c0_g1_i13.p2  ORF type:complete len:373 (+),score=106.60 TRINITY_DN2130_c0_g1_i13:180-1298(+)
MASASPASAAAVVRQLGARRRVRDYLALGKYRLSAMVALTATAGCGLRSDESPLTSPAAAATAGWTTAGTFLTALSANTLNQMYEIRSDALMGRTRARPLPAGRLSLMHAGLFAAATAGTGLGILKAKTNDTAAALGAANIALYAGVYTPLKPISVANTWVGAVVGAIPPLLGWAAASGGDLSPTTEAGAYHLGAALFLWQIPHFHALAVMARADYAAARLRMLAVSNPQANARWARLTAAALVPFGAGLAYEDVTSGWFGLEAAAGGAVAVRQEPPPVGRPGVGGGGAAALPCVGGVLARSDGGDACAQAAAGGGGGRGRCPGGGRGGGGGAGGSRRGGRRRRGSDGGAVGDDGALPFLPIVPLSITSSKQ